MSGTLGCSLIRSFCGGFHAPELSFNRVDLQDISLTGITVNVHFNLKNDNPVGIRIAQLAYDFRVNNHPFLAGHPPNGLTINPDTISDLSFPAHVEFRDLAATIEEFLHQDTANYTASGNIGVQTPIGVLTFPLSHSGSFPVPKLPDIQIQQPTLNNITLSSAHLTVPIALHNKNGFSIPFGGLSTQVFIGGAPAIAPTIPNQSALAPNETRVVPLGVDVNFMQAGMAVANAIRNRQANVQLRGTANIGGLQVPINLNQNLVFH
ncbi:MAG: LEA type 2 family protein [Deltaproteobacteria bacterium]|nr:LEA type 2 family protein [Deltaproteobacteria bacterium]